MPVFAVLLLLFITIPLAEIYLLIRIGSVIGALPTIGLAILTAIIGAFLVRQQGLATLGRAQTCLDSGEIPAVELLEGVVLLLSGALLLVPGFFTDIVGFVMLVPTIRRATVVSLLRRYRPIVATTPTRSESSRTLEGEYRVEKD